MNPINQFNTLWMQSTEDTAQANEIRCREALNQLELQVFEERQCHWRRLNHLKSVVVPLILEIAHQELPSSTNYERDLLTLVRRLVPAYNMRRMVHARVVAMDPWFPAGGPAFPAAEDVVGVEAPAEVELFSSLLGLDHLLNWATEDAVPVAL
ncbi:hypothetical protein [Absidia glauca]|uniref:Uncharacterized protein n=1 Tax=Absidia glauca TaxID=4829 RepID=A0A163IXS2_ABSGL|nr:hypothetical protein [Absidia glauca]